MKARLIVRTLSGIAIGLVALMSSAVLVPAAIADEGGWPVESRSDSSNNTWAIQYLLRANTLDLAVDGMFGPQTGDQVAQFQMNRGLTVDGIVGPQTWMALTRDADQTPDGVRAIQSRLSANGYGLCVDGSYGPLTQQAVSKFQAARGQAVNGIVSPGTWQLLVQRLTDPEFPAGPQPC